MKCGISVFVLSMRESAYMCVAVVDAGRVQTFVSTISYKLLVRISPDLYSQTFRKIGYKLINIDRAEPVMRLQ